MTFHITPFINENAEHHGIASGSIPARLMMPNDTVLLRSKRSDRLLRREVEVVGAKSNHFASERLERVRQQQDLARGIHVTPVPACRVPRVSDLNSVD